jgi:hypothetical protein
MRARLDSRFVEHLLSIRWVLKTMEIHDNSIGRSARALRKLKAAKFVREHGGQGVLQLGPGGIHSSQNSSVKI